MQRNTTHHRPAHMLSKVALVGTIAGSTLISGCAVVDTVNTGRSLYQGYSAHQMATDVRDAEPVFEGVTHYQVDTDMLASDEDHRDAVEDAFEDNLYYAIDQALAEVDLDVDACRDDCPEDTLVIQFREQGRDGFVERWTMGDSIGGDLYFVHDGQIVDEAELDLAPSYAEMSSIVQTSVGLRALNTQAEALERKQADGELSEEEVGEAMMAYMDDLNELGNAVDPEHEEILAER